MKQRPTARLSFPCSQKSTTRDITVWYETRDLTAIEEEDYVPVQDSLIIPAGTASASIFVDIVVDDYLEEDEQFRVVLTGSTNAILAGGIQEAIGTIRNDDSLFPISNQGYMSASSYLGKTWFGPMNLTQAPSTCPTGPMTSAPTAGATRSCRITPATARIPMSTTGTCSSSPATKARITPPPA